MAVEIPVVIDIEKAFEDAAKRAKTAMKPLQEYIESAPAELFIDVRVKGFGKTELVNLFDNAKTSVAQFQEALDQVNLKIDKLTAKGGFNLLGAGTLTKDEANLLGAAAALEAKLGKVGDASSSMARIFSANIRQAETSLNKYIAKLDILTAKQNKAATVTTIGDKKQLDTGAAYKRYATEIEKVNAKIAETRKFLSFCTLELDNITKASRTAGVAVGQIVSQGQLMAAEWAKGHEALMRYNAALKTANTRALTLAKSIAGMALFYAPVRFVKNIREVTSEFEMQRVALGGIIQDTEKAQELFRQIKAAAIKSPFEIKDLVTYTKQLSAYRIETDKLFNVTMRLADISAGLGVDMNRLILAYGQVRAASVLRGQELRQFTEAGIPLVELLAEKFSQLRGEMVSTADVFELISKRAVPFSMIEEIFEDMTEAGGIFYNMQEKQSETLKGQWMKLKDAISIMYDEIGNTAAVHEAMEMMMSSLLKMFQNWQKMAQWIGAATTSLIAYKIASANAAIAANALTLREAAQVSALELNVVGRSKVIASLFGEAAATKVQIKLGNAYVRAKKRELVATNLFSKALRKLQVALLSNPYTLAVAGAAALVTGLFALIKTTKQAAITTDEFAKSLTNFESRSRTLGEQRSLIETYEQLADKANKTAQEQKKLDRATKELARTFPNAVTGINAETGALEINIKKIKELNKAEQELELARIRRDAGRAKDRINTLEKEQDLILKKYELGGHYDFGASGQVIPWTEDELAKMGERLAEIRTELGKLQGQVEEVNQLDFIGPLTAEDAKAQGVLIGWKKRLNEIHAKKVAAGMAPVFTPNDIETMGSVSDLWKKTKKGIEDATKNLEGFKNLAKTLTDKDTIEANQKDIEKAKKILDFWNAIKEAFGFDFSHIGGRDTRLSQLKSDISELTNAYKKFEELKKYKTEDQALIDIKKLFPQIGELTPTLDNVVAELEKKLAKVKADLAKSPKSKTLLDMQRALETEISNLRFDELKRSLDEKLKKLSDEIKRSETARNFYKDIFALTGDEKLATSLSIDVYGGIGSDFKERVQQQLNAIFSDLTIDAGMRKAIDSQDWDYIFEHLPEGTDKIREELIKLRDAQQKFSAEQVKAWMNDLKKAKTYADKRVELARKTQERIAEINASGIKQDEKDKLIARYNRREQEEAAKIEYEAFKESPLYVKMFDNLDAATSQMLTTIRSRIVEMMEAWKDYDPVQLKEMQSRLNEIDKQLARRNPFKMLADSFKKYQELSKKGRTRQGDLDAMITTDKALKNEKKKLEYRAKDVKLIKERIEEAKRQYGANSDVVTALEAGLEVAEDDLETQKEITDEIERQANEAAEAADEWEKIHENVRAAFAAMKELAPIVSDLKNDILKAFVDSDTADAISNITAEVGKLASALVKTAAGAATGDMVVALDGIAEYFTSLLSMYYKLGKYLIVDLPIQKWEKQMKEQEKIISDLERSYGRLGDAIEDAFGTSYIYNYNQMLQMLLAEQEAYEKQAEIMHEKSVNASGKDNRDAAKEAEQDALDKYAETEKKIQDLTKEMQAFFAGASLTQAAEDFANSWLEAYKQYGNTTDAIKAKMEDMINSLIVKSAMSEVVQSVLGPWFKELKEYTEAGTLQENMANLINSLHGTTGQLNDGLTVIANVLQSAGINLRQGVGQFTGISRDIASASEESILGLAAGINTQNAYMFSINENVQRIIDLMSGTTAAGVSPQAAPASVGEEGRVMPSIQSMVYDHLPAIHTDIAMIRAMLNDVIKTNGTPATKFVATKM